MEGGGKGCFSHGTDYQGTVAFYDVDSLANGTHSEEVR